MASKITKFFVPVPPGKGGTTEAEGLKRKAAGDILAKLPPEIIEIDSPGGKQVIIKHSVISAYHDLA